MLIITIFYKDRLFFILLKELAGNVENMCLIKILQSPKSKKLKELNFVKL